VKGVIVRPGKNKHTRGGQGKDNRPDSLKRTKREKENKKLTPWKKNVEQAVTCQQLVNR